MNIAKKIMEEYFNKNLIMTENLFQKGNIVGFVKKLSIMMKRKLEIIVT